MKRNQRSSTAGFSIIEVLVSIGIFSILLLASASFFSQINQSIKQKQYAVARIRLIHSLINIMGMPATLRASGAAAPTGVLGQCIVHSQGAICSGWANQPPSEVALYLPPITGTTVANLSGPLSGTPSAPLLFSPDGKTCDPQRANCPPETYPISVSTRALPICPPAYSAATDPNWSQPIFPNGLVQMSDCWQSLYIKIYYEFRTTAGAPERFSFAPVRGTIMVSSVTAGLAL